MEKLFNIWALAETILRETLLSDAVSIAVIGS
jgi:hypothetical protein